MRFSDCKLCMQCMDASCGTGVRRPSSLEPIGVAPQEGTEARLAQTQVVAAPEHYNQEVEQVLDTLLTDVRVRGIDCHC